MTTWTKKPFRYVLVGLIQGSASRPYEIVITEDTRDNRRWVSCNCPSYVRGRQNKNMQNFQRSCKHTIKYTLDDPEIDFSSPESQPVIEPVKEGERIPFVKPQLPARFEEGRDEKILNDANWIPTVKMDGHRALVVRQPYGTVEIFSRAGKRMTEVESVFQDLKLPVGTMLDTELCVGKEICQCDRANREGGGWDVVAHYRSSHPESLRLIVLDVLFIGGLSVMGWQYWERRGTAVDIVAEMNDSKVEMVETKPGNISTEEWLVALRQNNAEGVVFWNRNSLYRPGIRSSADMIKMKWELLSADIVIVAVLSPTEKMDQDMRRLGYGWADGVMVGIAPLTVSKEEAAGCVGKVMEVEANAILPSTALLYPRFKAWRDDKISGECEPALY